jgi:hypothetical protein
LLPHTAARNVLALGHCKLEQVDAFFQMEQNDTLFV